MSAGLLRRVVDTLQRYRAGLRADELVQTGRVGLSVDRHDVLGRPRPVDAELVKCGGEQTDDVFGSVREVVADAARPRGRWRRRGSRRCGSGRGRTLRWPGRRELAARARERSRRLCFLPGPCWGSRHGQCFRVQRNVDASFRVARCRPLAWHQHVDGLAAAIDDRRILLVEHDPKSPDSTAPRDAAVAEIQAEQVAVRQPRAARRSRGQRRMASAVEPRAGLWTAPPIPHSRSRDAELARNRAIVDASCDEALRSVELLGRSHDLPLSSDLHQARHRHPTSRLNGLGTIGTLRAWRNWHTRGL